MSIPPIDHEADEPFDVPLVGTDLIRSPTRREFLQKTGNLALGFAALYGARLLSSCGPCGEQKIPQSFNGSEAEKSLPLFEEPTHPPIQQLIANWEQVYRGQFGSLQKNNHTGYSVDGLQKLRLSSVLETGYQNSGEYYGYIRDIFIRYGIPETFIYPFVLNESGWTHRATSSAAAKGLFQFMPSTGQQYGLDHRLSPVIDERCDPLQAAEAAAKFLQHLHRKYQKYPDSWMWVLAAYNMGEGNVEKYLDKCGNDQTIANYFDTITQEVKELEQQYGGRLQIKSDIATLTQNINQLDQTFKKLPKDSRQRRPLLEKIRSLKMEKTAMRRHFARWSFLLERKNYFAKFFGIQRALFGRDGVAARITPDPQQEFDSVSIRYDIKEFSVKVTAKPPHNTLSAIAARHNVRVPDLKRWNKLRSDTVHPGDTLRIKLFGNTLTMREVCTALRISESTLLNLNPAIGIRRDKTSAFPDVILPDGLQLYLPKEMSHTFQSTFSSRLSSDSFEVATYRASGRITSSPSPTVPEPPEELRSDERLAQIIHDIDTRTLRGSSALEALTEISDLFQQETQRYPRREQNIISQIQLISRYREKIQQLLDAESIVGASLDSDPDRFFEKLNTLYESTDQQDVEDLLSIANMYVLFLDHNDDEAQENACISKLQDMQRVFKNIVDQHIANIRKASYISRGFPIPSSIIIDIQNAYEAAQTFTRYTQMSLWSDESIPTLVEQFRVSNLRLQEEFLNSSAIQPTLSAPKISYALDATFFGFELVVKRGWAISSLAANYGITERELRKANPELKHGLKAGSMITIPVSYQTYTVRQNDTLLGIANRFHITFDRLCQTNPILAKQKNKIRPGQTITIVGKKSNTR